MSLGRILWTYGTCNGSLARRHRWSGEVQFVLWRAGEQGHAEDFWYPMHRDHWHGFTAGALAASQSHDRAQGVATEPASGEGLPRA